MAGGRPLAERTLTPPRSLPSSSAQDRSIVRAPFPFIGRRNAACSRLNRFIQHRRQDDEKLRASRLSLLDRAAFRNRRPALGPRYRQAVLNAIGAAVWRTRGRVGGRFCLFDEPFEFPQIVCRQTPFNADPASQVLRHEPAVVGNRHLPHRAGNSAGRLEAYFPWSGGAGLRPWTDRRQACRDRQGHDAHARREHGLESSAGHSVLPQIRADLHVVNAWPKQNIPWALRPDEKKPGPMLRAGLLGCRDSVRSASAAALGTLGAFHALRTLHAFRTVD